MNDIFLNSLPLLQRKKVKNMVLERNGVIEKKLVTGQVIICIDEAHYVVNTDGFVQDLAQSTSAQ